MSSERDLVARALLSRGTLRSLPAEVSIEELWATALTDVQAASESSGPGSSIVGLAAAGWLALSHLAPGAVLELADALALIRWADGRHFAVEADVVVGGRIEVWARIEDADRLALVKAVLAGRAFGYGCDVTVPMVPARLPFDLDRSGTGRRQPIDLTAERVLAFCEDPGGTILPDPETRLVGEQLARQGTSFVWLPSGEFIGGPPVGVRIENGATVRSAISLAERLAPAPSWTPGMKRVAEVVKEIEHVYTNGRP